MDIQIMIITHGKLAAVLLELAGDIVGRTDGVTAKEINRRDGLEKIKREIDRLSHKIPSGGGLLILTDMLGGTPSNVCMPLLGKENVEVISGVNFPMVITAVHEKNKIKNLNELSGVVKSAGKNAIIRCSESVDK